LITEETKDKNKDHNIEEIIRYGNLYLLSAEIDKYMHKLNIILAKVQIHLIAIDKLAAHFYLWSLTQVILIFNSILPFSIILLVLKIFQNSEINFFTDIGSRKLGEH